MLQKKSNEQMETMMKAFHKNTMEHMHTVVQQSNEMMAKTVNIQRDDGHTRDPQGDHVVPQMSRGMLRYHVPSSPTLSGR